MSALGQSRPGRACQPPPHCPAGGYFNYPCENDWRLSNMTGFGLWDVGGTKQSAAVCSYWVLIEEHKLNFPHLNGQSEQVPYGFVYFSLRESQRFKHIIIQWSTNVDKSRFNWGSRFGPGMQNYNSCMLKYTSIFIHTYVTLSSQCLINLKEKTPHPMDQVKLFKHF